MYALSSTLDSFKLRAGEHLKSFQQEVGDGNLYKGLELTRSERDTASFASSKDEIINQATAFITERFQGLGDDPILRGASTLTDHKSWPLNNRQQLLIYGEDVIQVLSQHFEALLNHHHFNSPVLKSGWKSRCICRGRGPSCSTVPLSSGRESFRRRNVSPIFCW